MSYNFTKGQYRAKVRTNFSETGSNLSAMYVDSNIYPFEVGSEPVSTDYVFPYYQEQYGYTVGIDLSTMIPYVIDNGEKIQYIPWQYIIDEPITGSYNYQEYPTGLTRTQYYVENSDYPSVDIIIGEMIEPPGILEEGCANLMTGGNAIFINAILNDYWPIIFANSGTCSDVIAYGPNASLNGVSTYNDYYEKSWWVDGYENSWVRCLDYSNVDISSMSNPEYITNVIGNDISDNAIFVSPRNVGNWHIPFYTNYPYYSGDPEETSMYDAEGNEYTEVPGGGLILYGYNPASLP